MECYGTLIDMIYCIPFGNQTWLAPIWKWRLIARKIIYTLDDFPFPMSGHQRIDLLSWSRQRMVHPIPTKIIMTFKFDEPPSPGYSSMIVTYKSYMMCINIYIHIWIESVITVICTQNTSIHMFWTYIRTFLCVVYPIFFGLTSIIADWSPSFAVLPGVSTANIYSCYCFNLHYE